MKRDFSAWSTPEPQPLSMPHGYLLCLTLWSLACLCAAGAAAETPGCSRARAMADEVQAMPNVSSADHRAILARLETAKSLCSSLGEIWRLAYCSAQALGDPKKASLYRRRAVLSGVDHFDCEEATHGARPVEAPRLGPVRRKMALVVGIGSFVDPKIPPLRFTAKDARDVARFLVEKAHFAPSDVTLLTDAEATRESIQNALQRLIISTREDDLVVLYISSHGSPFRENKGLSGIGYLVTHDTILEKIWNRAIEYPDFAQKVALIPARRVVTFLDTCFSGQAFKKETGAKQLVIEGGGVNAATAQRFLSGEGTFVVTSSRADERSFESEHLENSYFTHYLLGALGGSEPRTLGEVFEDLSDKVSRAVAQDKHVGQHPQIHPVEGPRDLRIGVVPIAGVGLPLTKTNKEEL